jgi:hypothetical protein
VCTVLSRDAQPLRRNSYWCIGWCRGSCRFRRERSRRRKTKDATSKKRKGAAESLLSLSFSNDTQDEPRAPPRKKTKVTGEKAGSSVSQAKPRPTRTSKVCAINLCILFLIPGPADRTPTSPSESHLGPTPAPPPLHPGHFHYPDPESLVLILSSLVLTPLMSAPTTPPVDPTVSALSATPVASSPGHLLAQSGSSRHTDCRQACYFQRRCQSYR